MIDPRQPHRPTATPSRIRQRRPLRWLGGILLSIALATTAYAQLPMLELLNPTTAPSPAPTTAPTQPSAPTAPPRVTPDHLQAHFDQVGSQAISGSWLSDTGVGTVHLNLHSDGHYSLDTAHGTYEVSANQLALMANGTRVTYQYKFDQGQLVLSGGDLRNEVRFIHQADFSGSVAKLLETSPDVMRRRLLRILIAAGAVLAAQLLIRLLQFLDHVMVNTERGPLAFLWRGNKARARTVHSLVLNTVKYIVYCFALGFILNEIGINYTAYLASLSVIGLAIGFGSQGLVQDMVTGFFLLFEDQFDVGDMVEMSGMTGVVVEFGLRTTILRSYTGQVVIIPNRNITQVGRYKLNSQLAIVDVTLPNMAATEPARQCFEQVSRDVSSEFAGVILDTPEIDTLPMTLERGRLVLRMRVLFWPTQTWVIDQQLVPRLRQSLKAAAIEVPAEEVVVFYHPRLEETVVTWRLPGAGNWHWGRKAGEKAPDAAK